MKIINLLIGITLFVSLSLSPVLAQSPSSDLKTNRSQAITLYNQSVKPLMDGDYNKALELLKAANDLDDQQPLIQNNYGLALLKVGKNDEALEHLLKATSSIDAPIIAWLNLGNVYETIGSYQKAIESFEKYLSGAPTSLDAPKIRAHLDLLKNESLTDGQTEKVSAEDYFDAVTKRVKLRWPADAMPVKVYMEDGEKVSGFKPEYALLLKQAFENWQLASQGEVSIIFVKEKRNANITTRWSNDLSQVLSTAEGGEAKYSGTSKGLTNVSITLLTVNPSSTMALTPNMVSWVVHHEVGHALGLLGHSQDINDVMYFSAPQMDKPAILSDRDVHTIIKLYKVDFAPTALTLNDEGVVAQQKGNNVLAMQKYKEALVLDPSNSTAKRNLVLANSALAIELIKQGKLEEGEVFFKEALAIENEAQDEHLKPLLKNYCRLLHMMHKDDEAKSLTLKYKDVLNKYLLPSAFN